MNFHVYNLYIFVGVFNLKVGGKYTNKYKMKRIVINHGIRKELMDIFGTTYPTIRNALNYQTDTTLAKKIRKAALNKGGNLLETTKNK